MLAGVVGVLLLPGQQPRGGERGNDQAESHHGLAMRVEVGRIGEAIATDVGAAWVLWIGPPVIAFGVEVVWAAGASIALSGRHRDGLCREVFVCGGEDTSAVGGGDQAEGGTGVRLCCPGRCEGRGLP